MEKVKIYTKQVCPYCVKAKALLKSKGVTYEEVDVEAEEGVYEKLKLETGMRTVPQIFIAGKLVGGFSELDGLNKKGELDALLGLK